MSSTMKSQFTLDPDLVYLNHGSFGACPRVVQAQQERLRQRLERQPVRFLYGELEGLLDEARRGLAAFIGAAPDDLAFVTNATTAVNAVLRSIALQPGDEILTTDHAYNACMNSLDWIAGRTGARVVVAEVPFPLEHDDQIVDAVLNAASARTRLALLDHVTSPTALVLPIRRLVAALEAAGIDVLVDGAHGPGMLPLDVAALDAAYYVGNCHKWLCSPKGAAFLVTRKDRQDGLAPPVISHGWNDRRATRSRYKLLFDWTGTCDPSPVLCVPDAIAAVGALWPGGWPAIMAKNHALAVAMRSVLLGRLGVAAPCPEPMLGAMASIPIGPGDSVALHDRLLDRHGIEVPVFPWRGQRMVRVSAQLYNELSDSERLAQALEQELGPTCG
jgi:isopenicillin-N epimerase